MDIENLKTLVTSEIDARYQQLRELSLKIHSAPELGFHEFKAATWLTQYLEENGFSIERGICELPTAFRGSYGEGKPAIAILAEYDALPGLGHACGHNLIAACAAGALRPGFAGTRLCRVEPDLPQVICQVFPPCDPGGGEFSSDRGIGLGHRWCPEFLSDGSARTVSVRMVCAAV